jgi:hypothetical protein
MSEVNGERIKELDRIYSQLKQVKSPSRGESTNWDAKSLNLSRSSLEIDTHA